VAEVNASVDQILDGECHEAHPFFRL
jgi:hypothetical protein